MFVKTACQFYLFTFHLFTHGGGKHLALHARRYSVPFLGVLANHSTVLKGLLFGHMHTDEWRADESITVGLGRIGLPILVSSSVTPIYNNNPTFKVIFLRARYIVNY